MSSLREMTAMDGPPLGLFRDARRDAPSLEHDGSGPGFHAALVVVPSKGIVVAMVTNGGSETEDEAAAFADVLRSTLNAVPAP